MKTLKQIATEASAIAGEAWDNRAEKNGPTADQLRAFVAATPNLTARCKFDLLALADEASPVARYDVMLKRESERAALARVIEVESGEEWLAEIALAGKSWGELALEISMDPHAHLGKTLAAKGSERWRLLNDRWDAIGGEVITAPP